MGIILWRYLHNYYLWWSHRGREAFLTYEARRFDRHMADPHTSFGLLVTAALVAAIFAGAYELFALGVSKILTITLGETT
jgi:hypothetical protein